ncbi:unnamed protein product [marine sediment metagenome]|uniref:Uncharacterized protein n=1 Tax=marine sediment metagenome TaxID=412755 RepID=X1B950_9ZZZZ
MELKNIICVGVVQGNGEDVWDVAFYSSDCECEFTIPVDTKEVNNFKIGSSYNIKFIGMV